MLATCSWLSPNYLLIVPSWLHRENCPPDYIVRFSRCNQEGCTNCSTMDCSSSFTHLSLISRYHLSLIWAKYLQDHLRWRLTVWLINYSQNVYKHCAKKEYAMTLWRPVMETPNTVLFLECYIQCQARRNLTPAVKPEGALKSKRRSKFRTRCNSVTTELIVYRWFKGLRRPLVILRLLFQANSQCLVITAKFKLWWSRLALLSYAISKTGYYVYFKMRKTAIIELRSVSVYYHQ